MLLYCIAVTATDNFALRCGTHSDIIAAKAEVLKRIVVFKRVSELPRTLITHGVHTQVKVRERAVATQRLCEGFAAVDSGTIAAQIQQLKRAIWVILKRLSDCQGSVRANTVEAHVLWSEQRAN